VDVERRLAEWERFYDIERAHTAVAGKIPCQALRENL
jgi:hypothetical protein